MENRPASRIYSCESHTRCRALITSCLSHLNGLYLPFADEEDCIGDFIVSMLLPGEAALWRQLPMPRAHAYIRRCARNHVIRFLQRMMRGGEFQVNWSLLVERGTEEGWWEPADLSLTPEEELLRNSAVETVFQSLRRLRPGPMTLVIDFHLNARSIAELSASTRRKPAAIRRSLCDARRRVRDDLTRRGYTADDLLGMLCPRAHSPRQTNAETTTWTIFSPTAWVVQNILKFYKTQPSHSGSRTTLYK